MSKDMERLTCDDVLARRDELKAGSLARREKYTELLDFYEGGRGKSRELWGLRVIPETFRDALYGRQVERRCDSPAFQERIDAIYEENHFDNVALQVVLETGILGTHMVGPYYDERLARVCFRTRFLGDVYPWLSDTTPPTLRALLVEVVIDDLFTGESFLRVEAYTPWEIGYFTVQGGGPPELDRSLHPDGNFRNVYGVIPWVWFRATPSTNPPEWFGISDIDRIALWEPNEKDISQRQSEFALQEAKLMKLTYLVDVVDRRGGWFSPEEAQEFMDELECEVEFRGDSVPQSSSDGLERDLKLLAAGLVDPLDLVARYHGLSRAEAAKKLEEIRTRLGR